MSPEQAIDETEKALRELAGALELGVEMTPQRAVEAEFLRSVNTILAAAGGLLRAQRAEIKKLEERARCLE